MQKYILEGDPKEMSKVIQENRIRVERGAIAFTPVQPETVLDPDSIETLIESHRASEEACRRMTESQIELAGIVRDLVAIIVTSGQTIPDELVVKLEPFGIVVPQIAETVPQIAESAENISENVPENVPNDSEPMEDNKNVDVEDMTEVNLDDVKDTEENDTKEAPAPTPKKTRPKKSK